MYAIRSYYELILYPGASQVLEFAGGRVRLVGVRADRDSYNFV